MKSRPDPRHLLSDRIAPSHASDRIGGRPSTDALIYRIEPGMTETIKLSINSVLLGFLSLAAGVLVD
jgi:hypothetical protein